MLNANTIDRRVGAFLGNQGHSTSQKEPNNTRRGTRSGGESGDGSDGRLLASSLTITIWHDIHSNTIT